MLEVSIKCMYSNVRKRSNVFALISIVFFLRKSKYVLEVQILFPGSLLHLYHHPTGSAELSSNPLLPVSITNISAIDSVQYSILRSIAMSLRMSVVL
jgi:hypothetical protein